MDSLQAPDIKALEQTRQRLFQLTNSLASLQGNIAQSPTLPPWPSLQQLSTIISHNLNALSSHLSSSPDLFSTTVAYPLPSFPAAAEENLLVQLLRKKLEVSVEDWVRAGREEGNRGGEEEGALGPDLLEELWTWAGPAANEEARARDWVEEEYTLEERAEGVEKIVTGLKGRMGAGDESEDEDEDDEEEAKGSGKMGEKQEEITMTTPLLTIEEVLRFMSSGAEPQAR